MSRCFATKSLSENCLFAAISITQLATFFYYTDSCSNISLLRTRPSTRRWTRTNIRSIWTRLYQTNNQRVTMCMWLDKKVQQRLVESLIPFGRISTVWSKIMNRLWRLKWIKIYYGKKWIRDSSMTAIWRLNGACGGPEGDFPFFCWFLLTRMPATKNFFRYEKKCS